MKIILALFGFFLTASCLPAPGFNFNQQCEGSHCNQNTGVGAGNEDFNANIDQGCQGGNCNQDIAIGVDFGKGRQKRGINFKQRCEGSHCNQNTGVGAGNENFNANVDQDCEGGNCNMDIAIGVDHSKGWQRSTSTSSGGKIQNCKEGDNCQQDNKVGRKKRGFFNILQQCEGSHCGQNTGVAAGNENIDANVDQKCQGGECKQEIRLGVDFVKSNRFPDCFPFCNQG